jgi:predicted Zn-dependent peptidase
MNVGVLKNGVRYIVAPAEGSKVCAVGIWIRVGAVDEEPRVSGISHFIEHMLFRGGKKYRSNTAIFKRFNELGAVHNGETLKDYTTYYAKGYKKHLESLMELLSDFVLSPLLLREVVEKEKQIIIEEINSNMNNPRRLAMELMHTNVLGPGNVLSHSVGGTKETVTGINHSDLVKFYKEHYVSGNIVVSISGGIDFKEVKKLIEKYFGWIEKRTGVVRNRGRYGELRSNEVRIITKEMKGVQENLIVAFPLFPFGDPRKYTLTVLNIILGGINSSRLFLKVREKMGLVYGIKGNDELYWGDGYYYINTAMEPDNLGKVLEEILKELKLMTQIRISTDELKKAKCYVVNSLYLSTENELRNSAFYGIQVLYEEKKIMGYADIVQEVEKVTVEDVLKLAREIFRKENMLVVSVGEIGEGEIIKYI